MPQIDKYDEPGPIPADVQLRIYSNPICPYVQRVRIFAAAKGIKTEEIYIHLKVKPDWYINKVNPVGNGKVPAVQLPDGRILNESLIAAEFLDEAFGAKRLWPTDPFEKAQGKLFVDTFGNKYTTNFYKSFRESEGDHITEMAKHVGSLETKLDSSPFFGGAEPNALDYLIWPWFERLPAVQLIRPALATAISKEAFPKVFGWMDRMNADAAVKKTSLSTEAHLAFLKPLITTGVHDYGTVDLTGKGIVIYTKKE